MNAFVIGMIILALGIGLGLETYVEYLRELKEFELQVLYPKKFEQYKKIQKEKSFWWKLRKQIQQY